MAPFTPSEILTELDKLFLEYFQFYSIYRNTQIYFVQYHPEVQQKTSNSSTFMIYDIGFQHQTVGAILFNHLI